MATTRQDPTLLRHIRRLATAQKLAHLSDRELLQRFAAERDEAAFAVLVKRHGSMVLHVGQRVLHNGHDAEDVFQATFLVLTRKAGSLRWHESVGNWLYQTAYRIALKAKTSATRRGAKEARAAHAPLPASGNRGLRGWGRDSASANPPDDLSWREVETLLDEELHRLPVKYRVPLVFCYLEGSTRDEAAQQLGWSLSTLKRRLERGREMLRLRLVRRGLTFSAALFAPMLAQSTAKAALAPGLVQATLRSALQLAAGQPMAGLVSGPVAALVKGGLKTMFVTKAKLATSILLAVGIFAGAGALGRQTLGGKPESGLPGRPVAPHVTADKPQLALGPAVADKDEGNETVGPDAPIPKVQPDRIAFGTVHVGATVEASFMVLTPGKDAKTKLEVTAPIFVKVLRTTTDTQEYGQGNTFVRGSVEIAIKTTKAGNLQGQIAVKLGPTTARVPVSAFVKPQRTGLMRLLVVETPFERYSTKDGRIFKQWTDLVAASPWDVSYLLFMRGQPVLPKLHVGKSDAVLLGPEAVRSLTSDDVKRVQTFADSGGLVLVAADSFFIGSPTQANKVLVRYGLEMRDEERHLGSDNLTLGKAELDPQVVKAGIESTHFYRASPVAINNGTAARALVRAVNVGQLGDAFVATAKTGKGNVVAIGQSLWWSWISTSRDPSGGNAKLLRWILNDRHERRQRVVAFGRPLTAPEIEGYWKGLASEDADEVSEAIEWLTRAPESEHQTIPFLRQHLKPEPPPNAERLRKLIAGLADDKFTAREASQKELEKLGDVALPALQKEVQVTSSPEVRRRAVQVIEAPPHLSREKLRAIRGVEVLEQFGTAEAKQHLAILAKGAPGSRLTDAAKAALERLAVPVKAR